MTQLIEGVFVKSLRRIPDERGCISHMLRADDENFERFGEIYFSAIRPGVVKAWHLHKEMALNYAVVKGMIKLVLFDDRNGSATSGVLNEFFLGTENYSLVHIPPLVWNGFKCVGSEDALVANCSTIPHDPKEIVRKDPFVKDIPYDWSLVHG